MMTPQQALRMIAHYEKAVREKTEKPEKLVQALNRVSREAIGWALNAQKRDTYLLDGLNEARTALGLPPLGKGQAAQVAPVAPGAAPAAATSDVPRGPNGLRLNPDGSEMDAAQSALEDQMDAAVSGAVAAGEIPPSAAPSGGAPGRTPYVPPQPAGIPETVDGIPVSVPVDAAPAPVIASAPAPAAPAREAAMERAIAAQRAAGAPQKA